jgi:hypothetical protein
MHDLERTLRIRRGIGTGWSPMNAVLRGYMKANPGDPKGKKANPAKAHANRGRSKRFWKRG